MFNNIFIIISFLLIYRINFLLLLDSCFKHNRLFLLKILMAELHRNNMCVSRLSSLIFVLLYVSSISLMLIEQRVDESDNFVSDIFPK